MLDPQRSLNRAFAALIIGFLLTTEGSMVSAATVSLPQDEVETPHAAAVASPGTPSLGLPSSGIAESKPAVSLQQPLEFGPDQKGAPIRTERASLQRGIAQTEPPPAEAKCEQMEENSRKLCLQKRAIDRSDTALCLAIPKESIIFASRCACLTEIAKKVSSADICDQSEDAQCAKYCRLNVEGKLESYMKERAVQAEAMEKKAIAKGDASLCDGQETCLERSMCIYGVARKLRNTKLCARVRSCPNELVGADEDERTCVTDVRELDIDDAVITKDVRRCDRLKGVIGSKGEFLAGMFLKVPLLRRDFCRIKMAVNFTGPGSCNAIKSSEVRDNCIFGVAISILKPMPALCKKLRSEALRKNCALKSGLGQAIGDALMKKKTPKK